MYEIIKHFKEFLKDKTSISLPIAKFYVRWVNLCCDYLKIEANYALNLYNYFLSVYDKEIPAEKINSAAEWIILADKIHNAMRLKHLSRRTEETYLKWIRNFYSFINHKRPEELTPTTRRINTRRYA